MAIGAILEPTVVISLLSIGTWINRQRKYSKYIYHGCYVKDEWPVIDSRDMSPASLEPGSIDVDLEDCSIPGQSLSLSLLHSQEEGWRTRYLRIFSWKAKINSPNTAVFRNRSLSRLLLRFPFLVEVWYWALIYWVYQLGRAATALMLKEHTVTVARQHAQQVITLERKLGIFHEVEIQRFFMSFPMLMAWMNWIYSFIHIPGTIAFLVWLYYYTITMDHSEQMQQGFKGETVNRSPNHPAIYAARRRTMAVCNLLAFVIFTVWPCMPPRLLSSNQDVTGVIEDQFRSYGFIDTVHGNSGAGSVWTQNRFCNQYAAMPSLHFGYSLVIGLTIVGIPLGRDHRHSTIRLPWSAPGNLYLHLPSWRRLLCVAVGFLYPFLILCAILATANHFILDAVAGGIVCGLGWWANSLLLNFLPLEDWFLSRLHLHKPEKPVAHTGEEDQEQFAVM